MPALMVLLAALQAMTLPAASEDETPVAEQPAAEASIAYKVNIEGVDDSGIRSLLERSSQLLALADKPPLTQAGLERRIQGDFERFRAVLRSEGYYDSLIDYRIDDQVSPIVITVVVDVGPVYRLQAYDVVFENEDTEAPREPPPLSALGLRLGERARSADVITAEQRLLSVLAEEAHPLAERTDRQAIVNHDDRSMKVTVRIDPKQFSRFGVMTILGLDTVQEVYIRRLIPWREGDPYDQRKVDAFRRKLIKTGLFSTIVFDREEQLDADGTLPMTVQLIEGKQRSIGAGAKYYTSEGPAAEVFWEHRNLFGQDEDLRITLELGMIRQQATLNVIKPNWRRPDQDLLAEVQATRQTTDAFDEIGVSTFGKVRRPLSETWTGSVGLSLEWSQLEDDNGTNTSTLLGAPLEFYRDATDNLLDPREGMRLRLESTPYIGWFNEVASFVSSAATISGYQPLDSEKRFVLAGRAKAGTILGESREDIPANKRFYAGGGDSIRGYQFQKVGPLDDNNDPLGGRSVLEFSAELRAQVWGNFGLVPFIDGGNVYTQVYPDFSEELRWAAGIGARYTTVVGPVRFDIAFPLNPPRELDDPFQFYVSLGQAF
ncbi:MAG: outer membrane protein assembly factor [Rhodospirillales bacterium]|nr:outer membrane protein assembly factor [Rhodospirillales bacterium]